MKWLEAVAYMKKGGRIARKHWLKHDYLYMEAVKIGKDNICWKLLDDGGNLYFDRIGNPRIGNWIKKAGASCA